MRIPRTACLVASVLALTLAADAQAKAAFAGKAEMVNRSTVIALVEITGIEPANVKGTHWTYRQRASARVEAVFKGDAPKEGPLILHGEEDFICAQCRFSPGRYLVFLSQDGDLWVGSNWHLSVRPIATDAKGRQTVDWYADDTGSLKTNAQPLNSGLADVKKLISSGQR